jgi:hypothetical protein
MTKIYKIEAIAKGIIQGYYGSTQQCGTEWQKWTYAVLQANKIYQGDWKVDENTNPKGYKYVKEILEA